MVLIQTRWREDDPAGWFQREFADAGWELLSLPAVSEEREEWAPQAAASGCAKRGAAMAGALAAQRSSGPAGLPYETRLRARLVGALPAAAGTGRGNAGQVGVVRHLRLPPERLAGHAWRVVMSVDSARGDKDINDPSVVGVWAQTRTGHYLLDVWRDRVRYPQLKLQIEAMARRWQPSAILIEKASSGIELLQDLAKESCLPCIECSPAGKSKEVRLDAAAPAIEAGRVHLPHAALWLPEFKREIITFPMASTMIRWT